MDQGRLEQKLKLNLGCGNRKFDGFVNVDKYGNPDQVVDLEAFPWPWAESSADEVVLIHVLEHLGETKAIRQAVVQELYRVCAAGARVSIVVPHVLHQNYRGDPTHVWPVTLEQMTLLDRELCEAWQAKGFANTPLALYWGVDFKIVGHKEIPDEPYNTLLAEKAMSFEDLNVLARERNNVIAEIHLVLEARK